jgi:predicted RNA-binding protein associated with RNAse of E/G family
LGQGTKPRLHLKYIRLPDHVSNSYEELIYKSQKVIVGRPRITSEHKVVFDGEAVLARGFQIVFFDLIGKWFSIGKIRDSQGRFTGYYCDIATPPRPLDDGGVELTDLFLDLWVSPELKCKVLDEEELEEALHKGWITRQPYEKAKAELAKLIKLVERGRFPPQLVRRLELELNL